MTIYTKLWMKYHYILFLHFLNNPNRHTRKNLSVTKSEPPVWCIESTALPIEKTSTSSQGECITATAQQRRVPVAWRRGASVGSAKAGEPPHVTPALRRRLPRIQGPLLGSPQLGKGKSRRSWRMPLERPPPPPPPVLDEIQMYMYIREG